MSSMSFMEELLDGVVVEWKPLWEVTTIKTGQSVNKQMISANPGEYPVINSGREPLGFINEWNTDNNPIGVTTRGAGVGSITWQEGKYFRGNLNYSVTINSNQAISIKYLYYLLLEMQSDIQALCTYDGIPALNAGNLKELRIPIPCPKDPTKSLKIQAEIVRILDAFTELTDELTAELTAELAARKKQHNYYRDRFFSFEEGRVKSNALGEIGDFTYGYVAKAQEHGDARFVRITDINTDGKLITTDSKYVDISPESERFTLKKNDLLMARTGATYGKTMIFEEDYPAIYAGFLIKLSFDTKIINPRFYWHFAQSSFFWNQANNLVSGGGQPQFNANALKEVKIPVPSITSQARIVAILDKLDAFNNSISESLSREIDLRQKQYEHYRNLLLGFPKPEEVAA